MKLQIVNRSTASSASSKDAMSDAASGDPQTAPSERVPGKDHLDATSAAREILRHAEAAGWFANASCGSSSSAIPNPALHLVAKSAPNICVAWSLRLWRQICATFRKAGASFPPARPTVVPSDNGLTTLESTASPVTLRATAVPTAEHSPVDRSVAQDGQFVQPALPGSTRPPNASPARGFAATAPPVYGSPVSAQPIDNSRRSPYTIGRR